MPTGAVRCWKKRDPVDRIPACRSNGIGLIYCSDQTPAGATL